MSTERYIIMSLADAQGLAAAALESTVLADRRVIDRLQAETGADIRDIVVQLSTVGFCHACIVEGQQSDCHSLMANRLGRRLRRLVERADGDEVPEAAGMTEAAIDHEVLLLATDLACLIVEDDESGDDMAARGPAVGSWLRELVLKGIRSPRSSDPAFQLPPGV